MNKEFFQQSWIRYSALVLSLGLLTWLGAHYSYRQGDAIATQWTRTLQPTLVLISPEDSHFCPALSKNNAIQLRLEEDYSEVKGRMEHHLAVLRYFYANYFRAVIMGSVLGAIAGICLFYIANKGWTNANNLVVVVFVFATVAGVFFLSYINVFREQENIADNKTLYLTYVALGNRLLTYCATGTTDDVPQLSADKETRKFDEQMAAANNIAIGFDYTKLADYKSVLKTEPTSAPQQRQDQTTKK